MSCVYGVCAFVLLRCFSCSHTVLPKEHSLGVIFFLLTFLMLCSFFNSTCISLLIILCMIVYVTNNKEPWTSNLDLPGVWLWVLRTVRSGYTLQFGRNPPRFDRVHLTVVGSSSEASVCPRFKWETSLLLSTWRMPIFTFLFWGFIWIPFKYRPVWLLPGSPVSTHVWPASS